MVVVIAVILTAITGLLIYGGATSDYEGTEAAVWAFVFGLAGSFALASWSVGLFLVLGDRYKGRRWYRLALTVPIVVAVVAVAVLLFLASG